MKNLYESLLDDFDTLSDKLDPKGDVIEFLKRNVDEFKKLVISDKPNKDGLYEVSSRGDVTFYNRDDSKRLTNGLFIWTTIKGDFDCSWNTKLETLEGGPKKVGGRFTCSRCTSLKSLEWAPKEVGQDFELDWCESLTSLKGAPQTIPRDFNCCYCTKLKSLKYGPKAVGGNYFCAVCGETFSSHEINMSVDVGGRVIV